MSDDLWSGVPGLLSRLEDIELPLLSWGVVDGSLSATEVRDAVNDQLDADGEARPTGPWPTEDEYVDYLLANGLLYELPDAAARYRTRLAEGLRLLRNLRQLLPRDVTTPGWWRHAPALVADYRLRVSPRWYPDRRVGPDDVVATMAARPSWKDADADVLRRIVSGRPLADFQVRAADSILSALKDDHPAARIVTAGTGSGKTMAFYLPALLDIASRAGEKRIGPHTLALYPRNELLRDQARETLRLVQELGPLNGVGTRRARIGILYGNTPWERDLNGAKDVKGWQRADTGWVTPYFPCPAEGCEGDLLWTDIDRSSRIERLTCVTCGATTEPMAVSITRESIRDNHPDILFTSTEMLNKQSTNTHLAAILGWKGANGTRLVLLDEVHTYSGVHGAQVALMLRRWRYANTRGRVAPPVFVGLSATLKNAGDFFATMTGVERSDVEVISPDPNDLRPVSREYGIVLRGDPLSGAALLSSTIQTLMLLTRILDNRPGTFGSIAFAFTDDLDIVNRLYDGLRDAEGHDPNGLAAGNVLAEFRAPAAPQSNARQADGQSWDLPDRLRRMGRGMAVARTSSQDAGVDKLADIIVATPSLEVGFNDLRVGLVVQHKAPRDMAAFLQRRGRAGRYLAMRPITAVVLSDYGRDRIAYQSYEQLLDPEISARSLPIRNRFVLKIQATHALLDWIMRRLNGLDARWVLQPPWKGNLHRKTGSVAAVLNELVDSATLQSDLARHLERALGIDADEATAVLWEEPRSVMLSVIPTALRRLESSWKTLPNESDPGAQDGDPLPEFMTGALFEPLNTPDVRFAVPFRDSDEESMGIAQALREAVPGKVSRRYGYREAWHRTWLPVPPAGSDLSLTEIVKKGHGLGTWATSAGEQFVVVRPIVLKLSFPDRTVASTSSATPLWRSAFDYVPAALHHVDLPTPSVWAAMLETCAFALHVTGGPLRVRRMTIGSEGELLERHGAASVRRPISVRYVHDGAPAALGYELDVDGFVLSGRLPEDRAAVFGEFSKSGAWRTLAFRQRVRDDRRLAGIANVFQRDWLVEVYRHAHVAYCLTSADVRQAPTALANGRWADDIVAFFASAYRADPHDVGGARLLVALRDLVALPTVRTVLEEHGHLLVADDPGSRTDDLLDRVMADTLGCAVLTAVQESLPDAQEGDLTVDIDLSADSEGSFRVIVSETSIGGLGLLEELHRQYVQDPRQFWDAVERACQPTEGEYVDLAMSRLVRDLTDAESQYAPAIKAYRDANSIPLMLNALEDFVGRWTVNEGPPSHLFVSAVAARLLRPGSREEFDRVLADLLDAWVQAEERVGVEIDARNLVHNAANGVLGVGLGPLSPDMAFSLLWLRGAPVRVQRLEHYHPYRQGVVVERLLLDPLVNAGKVRIDLTAPDWHSTYVSALEEFGTVFLAAPYAERSRIADAMRQILVSPVERGGLRVFGRITSVEHRNALVQLRVAIAEDLQ